MLGLKRRKRKRLVEMTNAEAAEYYVERAEVAAENGQSARARSLFHSAVMHDPENLRAREGFEATANVAKVPPAQLRLSGSHDTATDAIDRGGNVF